MVPKKYVFRKPLGLTHSDLRPVILQEIRRMYGEDLTHDHRAALFYFEMKIKRSIKKEP